MSKQHVIVLSVLRQKLTPSEAAQKYGVSRQWVHKLIARYNTHGPKELEPRSRKPHTNPRNIPEETRALITDLRRELTAQGL